MLDLIEAGGSAASGAAASTWLSYAQMICSVRAVDGVPVQMPATKDDIRDLARRIGNEGIMVLQSLFFTSDSQEEQGLDTAKTDKAPCFQGDSLSPAQWGALVSCHELVARTAYGSMRCSGRAGWFLF